MRIGMRAAIAAWIICTGILLAGIETNAQPVPKEIAARVELYAIPSLTLSDRQFLTGDAEGKPVTVAGEFRIAQGSGRLPVVVLMHGSSGVGAIMEAWVHQFNAMGISTFVIDGFSGRGLTAVGPNQALVSRGAVRIERNIAGELHAGFIPELVEAIEACVERGLSAAGKSHQHDTVGVDARMLRQEIERTIDIENQIPDDYNPVASCKSYVQRLREAKRDVVLTQYPDSAHGFDAGLLGNNIVAVSANAQTARHCHIREGEGGALMNADTQAPFGYKDACIELNPHVGGNPATAEEARKAVSEFLLALFRLG